MSVYYKEKPEYLRTAIESMLNQTVKPDDFVLVCDGPLTEELDKVVEEFSNKYTVLFNVIRLQTNQGLGNALNIGLKACRNDLIARMDSDDISMPDRCRKQLAAFENNTQISIIGGTVTEFSEFPDLPKGKRRLPLKHEDIVRFSRKRNPFNHPSVMLKKSAVEQCGGYSEEYPLFEDYYLWVRMLAEGNIGENLPDTLVYMRAPSDMYARRGGRTYARKMLDFHKRLLEINWTTPLDFCLGAIPHALVCIMPIPILKKIYGILRKNS